MPDRAVFQWRAKKSAGNSAGAARRRGLTRANGGLTLRTWSGARRERPLKLLLRRSAPELAQRVRVDLEQVGRLLAVRGEHLVERLPPEAAAQ